MGTLVGSFSFHEAATGSPQSFPSNPVILDGWIDNRLEIQDQLRQKGISQGFQTDAGLIAAAYRMWGLSFAARLRGDFAFALWDAQRKQLVLGRDPLGVKPLYYHRNKARIIFSSAIASLLKDASVSTAPDESMIGQFLSGEFLDYEATFYKEIKQVPPAHLLIVDAGQIQFQRYWTVSSQCATFRSAAQYEEKFFDLFEKSVSARLSQKDPSGLLLSGGLDSSQICAMAETLRRQNESLPPLKAATLLVEGFLIEDKTALDGLSEKYWNIIESIDYAARQRTESLFELFLDSGNVPHVDGYLTTPLLMEWFKGQGCGTLLTGFGANELSNPPAWGYLMDLFGMGRWPSFIREANRMAESIDTSSGEVMRTGFQEVFMEICPRFIRSGIRRQRNRQRSWILPEFLKKMPVEPPLRLRPFPEMAANRSYQALFEPLIPLGLAQMDEAAANYGLEIRHPFLDLDLIEFFLSVPSEIKFKEGYRKCFVQKALQTIMPFPLRKMDDERRLIPLQTGNMREELEQSRLQNYLGDFKKPVFNYVDYKRIQSMIKNPESQSRSFPFLWRLVRLNIWLEKNSQKSTFHNDLPNNSVYTSPQLVSNNF